MYYFVQIQRFFDGNVDTYWEFKDEYPVTEEGCEEVVQVIELDFDKIQLEDPEPWMDALKALNAASGMDDVFTFLAGVFWQGYTAGQNNSA